MTPVRRQPLYLAHLVHRISGLALALFLPVHFWLLSLALRAPERFDRFIHWSETPLVKIAEFGLVFLLAAHFFGGLRLLALEWLPWRGVQKTWAAAAVAGSFLVSTLFLLQAL